MPAAILPLLHAEPCLQTQWQFRVLSVAYRSSDAEGKGRSLFYELPEGAEEAAKQLNVDLIWDGPTGLDAAQQNEMVEGWITRHVDAISVAVENAAGISTVLRKARTRGIKVVTWDADAQPDARDYSSIKPRLKELGMP